MLVSVSGATDELACAVAGGLASPDEYPSAAWGPKGFAAPAGALSAIAEISMHVVASNTTANRRSASWGDRAVNQSTVFILRLLALNSRRTARPRPSQSP